MSELAMKIKIIKAIPPELAESLRTAATPIEFLKASKSAAFLFDELSEAPYSVIKSGFYNTSKDLLSTQPISSSLGAFTFPEFDFSTDSVGTLTLDIAPAKELCKQVPVMLDFQLKNVLNKLTPVTFGLEIKVPEENFATKGYGATYFCFKVSSGFHQNYIFNIAAYFYNKFNLYKKTKRFLASKQLELTAISNSETFVATLLALFSAEKAEAFKLKIPAENLSKELLLLPATDQIPAYKSLFKYMAQASPWIKDEETDRLEVFIGEKTNTLAIVFDLDYESSGFTKKFRKKPLTDVVLAAFKADQQLDTLINATLSASLENYLAFSNFSSKLIATVKTKFLLNKI
jgi:hypothetical protein